MSCDSPEARSSLGGVFLLAFFPSHYKTWSHGHGQIFPTCLAEFDFKLYWSSQCTLPEGVNIAPENRHSENKEINLPSNHQFSREGC